jgi:hypothetical protein
MTIPRKRAGAEQHDDADHQQPKHSQKQDVRALTVHKSARWAIGVHRGDRLCNSHAVSFFLLLCVYRFGWHEQLLSDLQFARIYDVIDDNQIVVRDF